MQSAYESKGSIIRKRLHRKSMDIITKKAIIGVVLLLILRFFFHY